ncbi:hypothetical protein E1I21_04160 [Microbacterium oleivorans]|nr:hypothetical protein E1I21_04160 [Microbacterium oleivorans]
MGGHRRRRLTRRTATTHSRARRPRTREVVTSRLTWAFFVGHQERHSVRIEKHRTVFFAGFRPQPVYAFIDDVLVAQGVA